MRRMEKVTGRSDDMIILRGVNLFPTQIEEVLVGREWCGGHFLLVVSRTGRLDDLTVHAEARPDFWDGAGLLAEAEAVVSTIKNTIGVTTRVVIEPPGTLERSVGKARRVIDNRPRD
jgi:phenylacetate-CoA ligase